MSLLTDFQESEVIQFHDQANEDRISSEKVKKKMGTYVYGVPRK